MTVRLRRRGVLFAFFAAVSAACRAPSGGVPPAVAPKDTPAAKAGERLFRETRFAEYFARRAGGDVNARLTDGDAALATLQSPRGTLPGPFRGQAQSCAACHMVDDAAPVNGMGIRTYADFSRQSAIPARADDRQRTTPRNSPALVNASRGRDVPQVWHVDGEFASLEELVTGSFCGRNFGWYPEERTAALAQIAAVIRDDDGRDPVAARFGALPYRVLLAGDPATVPEPFRLEAEQRLDVASATDAEIVDRVATLVSLYVQSLEFATNAQGAYVGSAYDVFLAKNGLPRQPAEGESDADYAARLAWGVARLSQPEFVGGEMDGELETHAQEFVFGPEELDGLRIFLARGVTATATEPGYSRVGNCVSCHPPPHFTDFRFHNDGAAQDEYDAVHSDGAFAALQVPSRRQRDADAALYLPPSEAHPRAAGRFAARPRTEAPGEVDLGLWNIFANASVPGPQSALSRLLCEKDACDPDETLPATIGLFKTPGLRDLGHSDPYFHTGRADRIEDAVRHYVRMGEAARAGRLRNGDTEMTRVAIGARDVASLAAFLRALDEDYD